MNKKLVIFSLSSLLATLSIHQAMAKFSLNSSGTTVGQTVTISGQMTGFENCVKDKDPYSINQVELVVIGGSLEQSRVDFSGATITATIDGQSLSGNKNLPSHLNNSGMATIQLNSGSTLPYGSSSTAKFTVSNVKIRVAGKVGA